MNMRELEMHQLPVVPFLWGHLPGADEDAQSLALLQLIVNPGVRAHQKTAWNHI